MRTIAVALACLACTSCAADDQGFGKAMTKAFAPSRTLPGQLEGRLAELQKQNTAMKVQLSRFKSQINMMMEPEVQEQEPAHPLSQRLSAGILGAGCGSAILYSIVSKFRSGKISAPKATAQVMAATLSLSPLAALAAEGEGGGNGLGLVATFLSLSIALTWLVAVTSILFGLLDEADE